MRTIINKFLIIILSLILLKINALALEIEFIPTFHKIEITTNKVDGTKLVNNPNKNDDKIHLTNKIIRIWIGDDGLLNVIAEIKDNKEEAKILIYNMLGKEIRKVYQGLPNEKDSEGYYKFTSQSSLNLPNNIYILVVNGSSYKIADKFIVSNR